MIWYKSRKKNLKEMICKRCRPLLLNLHFWIQIKHFIDEQKPQRREILVRGRRNVWIFVQNVSKVHICEISSYTGQLEKKIKKTFTASYSLSMLINTVWHSVSTFLYCKKKKKKKKKSKLLLPRRGVLQFMHSIVRIFINDFSFDFSIFFSPSIAIKNVAVRSISIAQKQSL